MNTRSQFLTDQRGVALPMAMLALLILSALVLGFSVLSATEPTIANNQLMVAQARSVAEAGVERAIWALNNHGIPTPLVGTAPKPYDGSELIPVLLGGSTVGGFRVTVTPGAKVYERNIEAVGWTPNDTTTNPKAHQRITVTVSNPQWAYRDPPAALSVRGELQIGGNSLVNSLLDTSCGAKMGTVSTGVTKLQEGAADVWGASDGNIIQNQETDAGNGVPAPNAGDVTYNTSKDWFDQYMLTDEDLNTLKDFAKARGTYYQGSVNFNASNRMTNGLIFVDTVSGNNISEKTPPSDFASVSINGNAGPLPSGIFSGWIIVNGTLSISGEFQMRGLVYAQNDISYTAIGAGQIMGAMVSRNIRDTSYTSIDSTILGQAKITYNCKDAKWGGGGVADVWVFKGGTYRELCDSCS